MILVITSAVNMDTTIPIASVCAKPFTVPLPSHCRTKAAIRVVILPSRMADIAFWNPAFKELFTLFPSASSSRTLAKMMTLASTAIPIPRMIPAIPGRVSVISNAFNRTRISPV